MMARRKKRKENVNKTTTYNQNYIIFFLNLVSNSELSTFSVIILAIIAQKTFYLKKTGGHKHNILSSFTQLESTNRRPSSYLITENIFSEKCK